MFFQCSPINAESNGVYTPLSHTTLVSIGKDKTRCKRGRALNMSTAEKLMRLWGERTHTHSASPHHGITLTPTQYTLLTASPLPAMFNLPANQMCAFELTRFCLFNLDAFFPLKISVRSHTNVTFTNLLTTSSCFLFLSFFSGTLRLLSFHTRSRVTPPPYALRPLSSTYWKNRSASSSLELIMVRGMPTALPVTQQRRPVYPPALVLS